ERGRVTQDARTNTLIVRDTPSQLEEITQLIDNLDRPERQVLIEARVVYATESFRRELGVDWGFAYQSPGLDSNIISPDTFNFPSDLEGLLGVGYMGHEGQSFSVLEARLRLGESQGKSNTISAPQIMTLNNQEAKIEQGTDVAVDVIDADLRTRREYVPATLELIVTPQITPDNNLILNLEVSDNAPGEGGNIEVKKAETTLFAEDGETIVIGGIKKLSESQRETGIPPLSRLPILGWLFKHELVEENMDELLIFIRPKIQ
ncbi:secretin N-terminal domain-containing protein, partial [Desulfonatronospira sp. MSAO_Bac3]